MKTLILRITASIFLGLTFISCEDFITQDPKYLLTPEAAITDENSAQNLLNGAYAAVGSNDYTARFSGGFSSMLGSYQYNSSAYNMNMQATGDNDALWKIFYTTINRANAVLENVSKLPDDSFKNPARKKEILAEAKGLRAFAHLYTFWYFGRWRDEPSSEYGLIFRDQMAELTNVYQPRLNIKDSYDRIIADLDEAIAHCPNYSTGKRVSKQLAKGLKAKLLLNRGWDNDYKEALVLVNDVIQEATAVGIILEPSLTSLYENSWDSKELLFCRYREQTDDVVSAYNFTYGYNYAITGLPTVTLAKAILESDSRFDEGWGMVRYPSLTPNTTNLRPKKLCRKGRFIGGDNDKYTTYFLRLTELYLMQAELKYRTGEPLTAAVGPINAIRSRSSLGAVAPANATEFEKLLFDEYFKELNLENDADWMASLRLKGSNGQAMIYEFRGGTVALEEDRFVWPIPTSEIKFNKLIKQNPSYESLVY